MSTATVVARDCTFTTVDSILPSQVGRYIMAKGPKLTCVELDSNNGLMELCTFNIELNCSELVSIGYGFCRFGRQIFKFGTEKVACEIPDEIHRDGFGCRIRYQELIQAISDTEVIHVRTADLTCWTLPDLIIRIYAIDGAGEVTMTEKTAKLHMSSMATLRIHQGYLVIFKDTDRCLLVDYRSATAVDMLCILPNALEQTNRGMLNIDCFDNGQKLGVFSMDNAKVNELVYQLDIVEGKFAMTKLVYNKVVVCRATMKVFGAVNRFNVACTAYKVAPGLIHVNSPKKPIMGRRDPSEEEFLIYVPTQTVLPIVGPKLNKNFIIRGVLTSRDGAYMAVMVTVQTMRNPHQLTIIDLKTGKTEHYFVNSMDAPSIVGFLQGNQAIIYNATVKGIPQVIQQPIFRARLDQMSVRLRTLMFEQLPLEVVMNITDFVDHDIRKRLQRNL